MIDVLFLAHNRLAFTRASSYALLANTNWAMVSKVILVDDQSVDGTDRLVEKLGDRLARERGVRGEFRTAEPRYGSAVSVMRDYLSIESQAEFFAKIDNDVIVPPGWLDRCVETFQAHPSLDLLGIEPPDSRKPHFSQPFVPQATRDREMAPGPPFCVPASTIGGIGVFRRSAFEKAPYLTPDGPYGGFEAWQLAHPEVVRAWIKPSLNLCLLDRLPIEPWKTYSEQYIAKGWQRKWRDYDMSDSHLWEWWLH